MLGSYVCRQCRARLSRRIAPVRYPQWQPRATFLSLRNQKTPDDTEPAAPAQAEAQPQVQPKLSQYEYQDRSERRYAAVGEQSQPRRRASRYSRHVPGDAEGGSQSAPFDQTDCAQHGCEDTKAVNPLEKEHGPASAIEEALSRRDVDKAWRLFERHYTSRNCEAFTEPSLGDVALLKNGKIFAKLLSSVNGAFCNRKIKPAVTPTMLLFEYEQLGLTRPEHWSRQTLAYLTHQAILAVNAPPEESKRDLQSILFELLSVWRLFFQCKGMKKVPLEIISTKWNLPDLDVLPELYDSKDFNRRLQEFHPGYVGNPTLGFCAVYIYTLSDAMHALESLQKEATPFIKFLGRVLAGSFVDPVFRHTEHSPQFGSLSEEVKKEIMKEIAAAPRRALFEIGSIAESLEAEEAGDPTANLEAFHLKRIARAIESKASAGVLDGLWKEVENAYTADQKPLIPPRIYNAFLSGYMTLLQAQRSVEIWNHMIAHGVRPDMQSWVALLEGCKKARDLNGLNTTWTRMLSTGLEPDNYAWTTRVHGLFSLGPVNLSLAALDEMGKRWLSAETVINNSQAHSRNRKGTKNLPTTATAANNCTKPSIEVINAAITALVQLPTTRMRHEKRVDLVQKILAWAGNFDIKPNAYTYNSLIKLYLRAGDYNTAFKVLRQMENAGIEGDIATHTMLITAAFDNSSFDTLSETEQTEKIIGLFEGLESGGIKLNDHIYGTAIDRLLKQYSNHNAVRAVIEHMIARRLVPNAHVYTSLITYYFQQTPPAIQAVDSLVDQFFTSHRVPTDRYLFDRTLEGYAAHGEVGKMMSVLTRMSKHGRPPSWSALTAVVEALIRDRDLERARAVVRDVERGEGFAKSYITGGAQGEARFFAMVKKFGVRLEEESMGDMWRENRDGTANEDNGATGEHLGESKDQRMAQGDETQDMAPLSRSDVRAQSEKEPRNVGYAGEPRSTQYERESSSLRVEEGEDVHGFLTDEHEDIHSRVNRP